MKVDLYCNNCLVAICSLCSHMDHRCHDISNLTDVYNKTRDTLLSHIINLETSDDSKRYSENLKEENQTLNTKDNLLMEIDEASSQIMTKVQEILVQLKEDVKSRVAKEKDQMNEQLEVIEKAERVKREHLLHCQQAAQFTRQEELVIMAVDLDKKTKSLIGTPDLPVLKIHNIDVDTAVFDDLSKVIGNTAIVIYKSELIQCIDVKDATIGEKSTILKQRTVIKIHCLWKQISNLQTEITTVSNRDWTQCVYLLEVSSTHLSPEVLTKRPSLSMATTNTMADSSFTAGTKVKKNC